MNDNVEIIRSNKGGMKIIHRGYMYTVHKKRQGGGIRWRCTQRSLHCKGSISTGNGPPSVNMPHNHIPDPHSVALARCRQLEEFPDITSLLETEYDEIKDSMPLQQRMLLTGPPQLQIPTSAEPFLQSQPLSPTKLKVTRQTNKPQIFAPKITIENPPEEVCLRWNSHHSNMQCTFPQLLEKEQYVDVTIIAEGKTLKCHRMILSSCSTYFEEILNGITPLQHPVIILKGIPFWILKALIDFMYVGEVNIDQNKLPELLDVAEILRVKGLAGKNANSDQSEKNEKQENQPPKKQQTKDTNVRQPTIKNPPQPVPTLTKPEEMLINDPLELLEAKFPDEGDGMFPKIKENKLLPKKTFTKKLRKRKSVEEEVLPLFPMRRGTRSRPNVKIPKYYDYEDIVKPAATDIQPFSPVVNIKCEPIDVEENDISYNESVDPETENSLITPSDLNGVGTNLKTVEKSIPATEPPVSTKIKGSSINKEEPLLYKIKIKRLSTMSENKGRKVSTHTDDKVLNKQPESTTSINNDFCKSPKLNDVTETQLPQQDDIAKSCDVADEDSVETNPVEQQTDNLTKSSEVVDEDSVQSDPLASEDVLAEKGIQPETPKIELVDSEAENGSGIVEK